MGLDQYAGLRRANGQVEQAFYWRKHARLQQFMAEEFDRQHRGKEVESHNTIHALQHLGFNRGEGGVLLTEAVIDRLEQAVGNKYTDHFARDGFFWGQQFQEEAVREYRRQDKRFVKWCRKQIRAGRAIGYDCCW